MSPPPGPGLSTPEGLRLARQLLRPQLPHDIHDHIPEGVCKAIDGTHVLAVLPTGGGRSGYFYCYILLLRALRQLSPPCNLLKRKYPVNPVMIGVFPTKGLEEEMETRFRNLDISALRRYPHCCSSGTTATKPLERMHKRCRNSSPLTGATFFPSL
ncbi:hypothetical protein BDZ97DRAFT_1913587 [Flammula alnicola]|nr:hypothetical protein BDZ97DRAFT_1913587 [Flammula alnicola]